MNEVQYQFIEKNLPSILLVDDKPENLMVLEKLLSQLSVRLIKASSGNEALSLMLQEDNLVLVLLDVHMPEMDGYEVLEIMYSNNQLKKIPVIFITAYYTAESHRAKGYQLGAVDYLFKPIEEVILLAKVDIFLQINAWREEIAALQRRNQLILDSAGEGIFGVDSEGNINFINPAASRMLGWNEKDLLNKSIEAILLFDEKQSGSFIWEESEIYKSSSSVYFDRVINKTFIKKDKSTIPVDYVITSLREDQDKYMGAVVVFTDATDRINNEKTLNQLQQSQKMESVGQLTGGIAHDFNNILMTVRGNLELLLLESTPDTNESKRINAALNGIERGAALTKRLLAFSRRQTLFPESIDLNLQLQSTIELLKPTLGETIVLKLDFPDDLWPIWVDPNQFDNVLVNLAINARDAMPKGGSIFIEAQNVSLNQTVAIGKYQVTPGEYVKISFTDNGSGMEPEIMSRIFEPFFTTKEQYKGTGLGLSMIYGFVTQSQGSITVYSEPGQGTTFNLYFPKSQYMESELKEEVFVEKRITGKEIILVVEDEAVVREVVAEYLPNLGYKVLVAEDGRKALKIIDENKDINLLFTDIVMPGGIGGTELAKLAKEKLPNLKVLLTSGYPKNTLTDHQISTEDHLMKPFKLDELAKKIRLLLGARFDEDNV